VHFYSTFWSFSFSNRASRINIRCTATSRRRDAARARARGAARRRHPRHPGPRGPEDARSKAHWGPSPPRVVPTLVARPPALHPLVRPRPLPAPARLPRPAPSRRLIDLGTRASEARSRASPPCRLFKRPPPLSSQGVHRRRAANGRRRAPLGAVAELRPTHHSTIFRAYHALSSASRELLGVRACSRRQSTRRSGRSSGSRHRVPPSTAAGRSSTPFEHTNRSLGEPQGLPTLSTPTPAATSPESGKAAGGRPPGTQLQAFQSFQGPKCELRACL
jgi:hypothetical protein